jgi:hypothetical protein
LGVAWDDLPVAQHHVHLPVLDQGVAQVFGNSFGDPLLRAADGSEVEDGYG